MHPVIDGETLLMLWEKALTHPAAMRGDALLESALAAGESVRTLGARNARLAELHAKLFGRELDLLSHCPACRMVVQFFGDCELLAGAATSNEIEATHRLSVDGHQIDFRLPDAADVNAAAQHEERFARALLGRCVIACMRDGQAVPAQALPLAVLDALSRRMEELDPAASVSFAIDCPQCAAHWDARLDLAHLLWQKLQAAAERLLMDINTLARNYGWTEGDVMMLSATRRAAYVQMATS